MDGDYYSIKDGEPRTATLPFIQLLSSVERVQFSLALNPQ